MFDIQRYCCLPLFATLPDTVSNALDSDRLRQLQIQVTEVDKSENVVMRPGSQLAFTSSFRDRSVLVSAGG